MLDFVITHLGLGLSHYLVMSSARDPAQKIVWGGFGIFFYSRVCSVNILGVRKWVENNELLTNFKVFTLSFPQFIFVGAVILHEEEPKRKLGKNTFFYS